MAVFSLGIAAAVKPDFEGDDLLLAKRESEIKHKTTSKSLEERLRAEHLLIPTKSDIIA